MPCRSLNKKEKKQLKYQMRKVFCSNCSNAAQILLYAPGFNFDTNSRAQHNLYLICNRKIIFLFVAVVISLILNPLLIERILILFIFTRSLGSEFYDRHTFFSRSSCFTFWLGLKWVLIIVRRSSLTFAIFPSLAPASSMSPSNFLCFSYLFNKHWKSLFISELRDVDAKKENS